MPRVTAAGSDSSGCVASCGGGQRCRECAACVSITRAYPCFIASRAHSMSDRSGPELVFVRAPVRRRGDSARPHAKPELCLQRCSVVDSRQQLRPEARFLQFALVYGCLAGAPLHDLHAVTALLTFSESRVTFSLGVLDTVVERSEPPSRPFADEAVSGSDDPPLPLASASRAGSQMKYPPMMHTRPLWVLLLIAAAVEPLAPCCVFGTCVERV
jgi:hypothetical protein